MTAEYRPLLRRYIAAARDPGDPNHVVLWDRQQVSRRVVRLSLIEHAIVDTMFRGQLTPREMQSALESVGDATLLNLVAGLIDRLDSARMLDSPRYRDFLNVPVRQPACIGSYSDQPDELREQLSRLFTASDGPGLPAGPPPQQLNNPVRAVLLPHMDYGRGNVTYGHGARSLFEGTTARLFVIIGTAHYSPARFTLSRQDFATPLGIVPTDQAYVDRLVAAYGDGLFDDPAAHVPEHSIELEVVLLQFLYEKYGPIRIVPLLVGSFFDCIEAGRTPGEQPEIARMVQALRSAEAAAGEPVCYVISGDLAHIGPKFGDPEPVTRPVLTASRKADRTILKRATSADADGYFRGVAAEQDRRRICGLSPTWLTLAAVRPERGKLLHYQQYVCPEGTESVSFASAAFTGGTGGRPPGS